ncbi:heavy-metal-associated domain-containing protein, partial [Streptococcus pyogenes]
MPAWAVPLSEKGDVLMAKEIFLVEGMSCASCALTIEKTVNQLPE